LKRKNLPQGLSISPILSILNTRYWIEDLRKELGLDPSFRILCYADDISFYCKREDFLRIGKYNFVNVLNSTRSSYKYGIYIDSEKSMVIKSLDKINKKMKLLGLEYDFESKILS